MGGPGSSVGIATDCGMGRSGIEYRWERDFPPVQTGPGAHQASCKMGTTSFTGVSCGRGVLLTTHPLLVPRSWKSRAIPILTLRAFVPYKKSVNLPPYLQILVSCWCIIWNNILLLLLLLTAIKLSLGGSTCISTNKRNKNKYT